MGIELKTVSRLIFTHCKLTRQFSPSHRAVRKFPRILTPSLPLDVSIRNYQVYSCHNWGIYVNIYNMYARVQYMVFIISKKKTKKQKANFWKIAIKLNKRIDAILFLIWRPYANEQNGLILPCGKWSQTVASWNSVLQ